MCSDVDKFDSIVCYLEPEPYLICDRAGPERFQVAFELVGFKGGIVRVAKYLVYCQLKAALASGFILNNLFACLRKEGVALIRIVNGAHKSVCIVEGHTPFLVRGEYSFLGILVF